MEEEGFGKKLTYDFVVGLGRLITLLITIFIGNFFIQSQMMFNKDRTDIYKGFASEIGKVQVILWNKVDFCSTIDKKKYGKSTELPKDIQIKTKGYDDKIDQISDQMFGDYSAYLRFYFGDKVAVAANAFYDKIMTVKGSCLNKVPTKDDVIYWRNDVIHAMQDEIYKFKWRINN